ncbi:MAG: DUF481 domain-containing protein [Verrucomicrobia bacterium]|nr:DUF481 domain-containing protein [Verrucomicrobiota bacterium]
MKLIKPLLSFILFAAAVLSAADVVETRDGSRITGTITGIDNGVITMTTPFAGDLKIRQTEVVRLETAQPMFLRLNTGEVVSGPVAAPSSGELAVNTTGGVRTTGLQAVQTSWRPGQTDPLEVARQKELDELRRSWQYRVGLDITGRDGNTRNFKNALRFSATLEGPTDRLRFYGSYLRGKDRGVTNEDELILGTNYTNFFSERMGWYVRTEFERDRFEDIDFRSTSGAGLTYRIINQPRMSLEGNLGLSYRYEDYRTPGRESDDDIGLDVGLKFNWRFADWGRLSSTLAYTPAFDDFGDFLLKHDSGVEMPLGASDFWVLRVGVANDYNSRPSPGRKKLDTTYYLRLILTWD